MKGDVSQRSARMRKMYYAGFALAALLASLCACAPASRSSAGGGAHATATSLATATLASRATATVRSSISASDSTLCGAWSAADGSTGQPVAAKYGAISDCSLEGDSWIIATQGLAGKPGVIGVENCHGDATCLNGQTDRGITAWTFYPAPYPGGVRVLGIASPGVLIIDDGGRQMRFTIATGAYQA